jgi:hypothetical protein
MRYFTQARSNFALIFLSLCAITLGLSTENCEAPINPEKLLINGNLKINGALECDTLQTQTLIVQNTINIEGSLTTATLQANSATAKSITTSAIKGKNDSLLIQTDLIISSGVTASTLEVPSFLVQDVKQWQLAEHDDFEDKELIKGWSSTDTSDTDGLIFAANTYLGGHCKTSVKSLSKVFYGLPEHNHIKIQAKYHMLDQWNGEFGYLKANNDIVWSQSGKTPSHKSAFNFGGSEVADPKYNALIDVTIPHSENSIKLEFGSSLEKDACEASYGIDDVMIFVK